MRWEDCENSVRFEFESAIAMVLGVFVENSRAHSECPFACIVDRWC